MTLKKLDDNVTSVIKTFFQFTDNSQQFWSRIPGDGPEPPICQ